MLTQAHAPQAKAGETLRTVLGSVNSAAVAVSSVFDSATTGVSMFHRFVKDASAKQTERSAHESHLFRNELIAETNMRKLKLEDTVFEYIGNDENRQARWAKAHADTMLAIYGESASTDPA